MGLEFAAAELGLMTGAHFLGQLPGKWNANTCVYGQRIYLVT